MKRSLFLARPLAALAPSATARAAVAPETSIQVAHTPWVGIPIVQNGKPVPLVRRTFEHPRRGSLGARFA